MYNFPWIAFAAWLPTDEQEFRSSHRPARGREDPGEAVITAPWPYMARTTWGDSSRIGHPSWMGDIKRFSRTYFTRFQSTVFFQGDVAVAHGDDRFSLHGRSDDVLNVNGHRVGTGQIESSILSDK
jgi:acrylyl-CoA reductase (NADPH)/3-hydroxypropionyl-CoA dehydratase/3-hydroxypropionyl-CoA synthetase